MEAVYYINRPYSNTFFNRKKTLIVNVKLILTNPIIKVATICPNRANIVQILT